MTRLDGRPQVLHLAYEDPRMPGAGGGSVRTAEINARLADRFDIDVVSATYPGCRPYVDGGVRYSYAGLARGPRTARIMSYFAAQPGVVRRMGPDLVVEDFGAPISSWGLPRLTRRPTVGVVQWLFAAEKSRQYHLPLTGVESFGVRSHGTLVAVSDDLGLRLQQRNPAARVHVVPNGLPQEALAHPGGSGGGFRFLGRLEDAQKGVSLLLRAYALVADRTTMDLSVAGEGPDRQAMTRLVAELGLQDRVRFLGAVPYAERLDFLAGADVVVMPSRYETFGMVAAEALAVGSPVVAFDIDCLRTLVDDTVGRRVPALDVPAFSAAMLELASDPDLRARLAARGRASVAGLTWDNAAAAQAAVYQGRLAAAPAGPAR